MGWKISYNKKDAAGVHLLLIFPNGPLQSTFSRHGIEDEGGLSILLISPNGER